MESGIIKKVYTLNNKVVEIQFLDGSRELYIEDNLIARVTTDGYRITSHLLSSRWEKLNMAKLIYDFFVVLGSGGKKSLIEAINMGKITIVK